MNFINTINSKQQLILPVLVLALLLFVINSYIIILLGALLFVLTALVFKDKFLIPFIVISFLILTSDFTEIYRNYINAFLILLIIYLYLKNFGISTKIIYDLPNEAKYVVALAIISMFLSSIFSGDIFYALFITGRQILFFLIVFMLFSFITTKSMILSFINALVISSIILGVVIFYEILTKGLTLFSLQSHSINQFSGLYSNPNAVGLLLTVSIPLWIGVVLIKRKEKNNFRFLYYAVLLFLLTVLLLTDSRASIGAVFISIFFILWKFNPKYLRYFFIPIIFVVLLILIIPIFNEYLSIYFRVERIFENTRFYIWDMTFNIIKHNFLFGTGPGLFDTKIYPNLTVMLGSFEEQSIWWARSGTAHNFFLFKFAEDGILGLITAFYLFISLFKMGSKIEKQIKNKKSDYYLITLSISSIGAGLLGRAFLESTGLLTNGWITRDLPFWIAFMILIHIYQKVIVNKLHTQE